MTKTDAEETVDQPSPQVDPRTMNAQMVDRLLSGPVQPLPPDRYALRVLGVRGRRSGRVHQTPVGLLDWRGERFLVSPDRTRDWPSNLRADPELTLSTADHVFHGHAEEITSTAAAEVVARYLDVVEAPWAIAAFGVPEGATVGQIAAEVDRMAVFLVRREH